MFIRGIILGFYQSFCCVIRLNFALVTVQSSAVCMEMYRDFFIAALFHWQISRQFLIAFFTNLFPNLRPLNSNLRITD